SAPSVLTREVSGETSAWIPSASAEMTVRQTPLTARLAPGVRSGASVVVMRKRNPSGVGLTSATSPIDSINPVNMALYLHVGADEAGSDLGHAAARQHRARQPLDAAR